MKKKYLKERINILRNKIKNENRKKFNEAVNSYFNFVDLKIKNEEGHDGAGYIAWERDSSNKQKEDLINIIELYYDYN